MTRQHTDREYERELETLHERIILMGRTVQAMIADSMRAMLVRDTDLAHRTIERDHEVNRLEVETDDLCLRILARRQPAGSDLRFVTIALKLVTDVERIGDLCVNIAERAIELSQAPADALGSDLPAMAQAAEGMVRDALQAFIAADAELAFAVIARDRTVDALYAQVFRKLLTRMAQDPAQTHWVTRVQAVAKYLERIGDHATNLAEMVVFMIKGKDIRHVGRLEEERGGPAPHGVLLLCVHNAARSQMAEGWARKMFPPSMRIWSAGSDPAAQVHPLAIRAMREVGIDIAWQQPKRISEIPLGDVDTVITLCAEEVCVDLPGMMRRETWALPDPVTATGTAEERLDAFRQVRDRIGERLRAWLGEIHVSDP